MAPSIVEAVKTKLNIGHSNGMANGKNGINGHSEANGHAVHGAGVVHTSYSNHPLDPLTEAEIFAVGQCIKRHFTETGFKAFKIVYICLVEPPKIDVLRYLGIPTAPDQIGDVAPDLSVRFDRRAEAAVIDALTGKAFCLTLDVAGNAVDIVTQQQLPEGTQPGITLEELEEAERAVRSDPAVQKLCADVGVLPEQICADGWSIGYEDRFPGRRLQQCLMYARLEPHENLYAHPLDFNVVVDSNTNEVLHIDIPPHRVNGKLTGTTRPISDLSLDPLVASGRQRIPPPMTRYDYLPDLLDQKQGGYPMRKDLKPLHVEQPEGPSFTIKGNHISWQKWDFHVAAHYREGLVFSAITYTDNGAVRPVFYRLGLAEMTVPYGAPEWPHPRKFAFDVGEYGMGFLANSLALGCDCLGEIAYLDFVGTSHSGAPVIIKNAICIHEEDQGLLWKHTDYRTGGKAHAVRSRVLIVSMICTVANYEYAIYYKFKQDGTIELEVKLTGVLNLYIAAVGEGGGEYGTEVAPQVVAHHHQHLFSVRVDPMVDGLDNSIIETDVVPLAAARDSDENFAGNAFIAKKTYLSTTAEGARVADATKTRTWTIANENKLHYASKLPVGYKIVCKDMPPLLAAPDSLVAMRAPFATRNLWVAPYKADQIYPAGKFVPQTMETPKDSILSFVSGDKPIRNTDIACWITWGVNHIARAEDYPVMPVEHCLLTFKPTNFFDMNPSLDVPQVADKRSRRVILNGSNGCCK